MPPRLGLFFSPAGRRWGEAPDEGGEATYVVALGPLIASS